MTEIDGDANPNADANDEPAPEYRYLMECPNCDASWQRKQNSKFVKSLRQVEKRCGECDCEKPLILPRDNRPNPPECPECDKKVLGVTERGNHTAYLHDEKITTLAGMHGKEILDSCVVS